MTEDEVIKEARRRYGAPVCLDLLEDAMSIGDFEEAVEIILIDSYYWDYAPEL